MTLVLGDCGFGLIGWLALALLFLHPFLLGAIAYYWYRAHEAWKRIPAGVPTRYGWNERTNPPKSAVASAAICYVGTAVLHLMPADVKRRFGDPFLCLLLIVFLIYALVNVVRYVLRLIRVFRSQPQIETDPALRYYARWMIGPASTALLVLGGLCCLFASFLIGKLR